LLLAIVGPGVPFFGMQFFSEASSGKMKNACRPQKQTLAARGLEEHIMRVPLIFAIIVSFMLFIVLLSLMLMYFFRRISDSRLMFLKNNLPNLLGLCHFPLNT
jgi:magnesium-transporting ATPase (P-type)